MGWRACGSLGGGSPSALVRWGAAGRWLRRGWLPGPLPLSPSRLGLPRRQLLLVLWPGVPPPRRTKLAGKVTTILSQPYRPHYIQNTVKASSLGINFYSVTTPVVQISSSQPAIFPLALPSSKLIVAVIIIIIIIIPINALFIPPEMYILSFCS